MEKRNVIEASATVIEWQNSLNWSEHIWNRSSTLYCQSKPSIKIPTFLTPFNFGISCKWSRIFHWLCNAAYEVRIANFFSSALACAKEYGSLQLVMVLWKSGEICTDSMERLWTQIKSRCYRPKTKSKEIQIQAPSK